MTSTGFRVFLVTAVEIQADWLSPGRYVIEVRTTEHALPTATVRARSPLRDHRVDPATPPIAARHRLSADGGAARSWVGLLADLPSAVSAG
jgi:hypothetical protein